MESIRLLTDSPDALEALSRVEILYTDLDGTLLGLGGSLLVGGEGQPSIAAAEAIMRVNAADLTVVITTGRNRIQAAELTRVMGWRGFIGELGGVVVPDRGADPIFLTGDWPEGLLQPDDTPYALIERAGAVDALMQAFPGRLEPHSPYHLNREATVLLRGLVDLADACEVLSKLPVRIDMVDNGIIHPLLLKTDLVKLPEIHAYHLMPPGLTKAVAITADLARRGLTRDQAAAIGDSSTDVAMADATGLMAVVANALDDAHVHAAIEKRDNVYATRSKRGEGWAEFAHAWVAARRKR